jgi:hypothetical protein
MTRPLHRSRRGHIQRRAHQRIVFAVNVGEYVLSLVLGDAQGGEGLARELQARLDCPRRR